MQTKLALLFSVTWTKGRVQQDIISYRITDTQKSEYRMSHKGEKCVS